MSAWCLICASSRFSSDWPSAAFAMDTSAVRSAVVETGPNSEKKQQQQQQQQQQNETKNNPQLNICTALADSDISSHATPAREVAFTLVMVCERAFGCTARQSYTHRGDFVNSKKLRASSTKSGKIVDKIWFALPAEG